MPPTNPIDTAAIEVMPTSLDPYGQLIKLLMPRAVSIAIFDRDVTPLWMADGVENADLQEMAREAATLCEGGSDQPGMARQWSGEAAYVFVMRDNNSHVLGLVGLILPDTASGSRPFGSIQGMLRPAIEVLARELAHQYNIEDLQRNLSARDGDLELLLSAADNSDDIDHLVRGCVQSLHCTFGAVLIPEKNISFVATGDNVPPGAGTDILARTHRHLLAWAQVQRRSMALNKSAPSGPLSGVNYKILVSPVLRDGQQVAGILALFRHASDADFGMQHLRVAELLARRVAHALHNAYDSATGLLTRAALEKRVAAALEASGEQSHSIVYVDIDRVHTLNENHGMHIGDDVIVRIGDSLRAGASQRAAVARIAGDRFAVFLQECALDNASELAERLCQSVRQMDYKVDRKVIELSASFGIARVMPTKHPLSHALAEAQTACKAAKERGRGRVEVYQDAAQSNIRRNEDVLLLGSVRDALANDRFRLEAQPIVDFGDPGKPRRFELLLRLVDANNESIAPSRFLAAAERNQLASTIDRWVLQFVLEILSSAADKLSQLGAHFCVNISGQSIGDEQFPAFVAEKLAEYALPPSLISFELAETAAVTNIVRAETLMRRLRDLGHEIALDDFGRGLSSLTYLQSLPASYLKIDGALVRDVVGNPRAQAMITAIVQLATTSNLRTIAECVESEAIMQSVAQLGVDAGQGFHIGRPRPLETVLKEMLYEANGGNSTSMIMRGISRMAG